MIIWLGTLFPFLDQTSPFNRHPVKQFSDDTKMLPISPSYLLYYLPLIIAISLVFGATRHENTKLILQHALQTGRWITGFMGTLFIIICILDWLL